MPHVLVPVVLLSLAIVLPAACKGTTASSSSAASSTSGAPAAGAEAPAPTDGQAKPSAEQQTLKGTIAETMNSGGYTYVRLTTASGDAWLAADEFAAKTGESLEAAVDMAMENFHSKTLNRDFPRIYFVSRLARNGEPVPTNAPAANAAPGMPSLASSHGAGGAQQSSAAAVVTPNAPPPGGHAIVDVFAKRDALAGQTVLVRGTVVKVNNGIMGRNWFHLRDGSGSEKEGTHDLTVTSDATVSVGDVVTVSGTLAVKKDFGAGYAYEAILEAGKVTGK